MKIVSVGLASAFSEGFTYQENLLCDQWMSDGNEVTIISDCNKYEGGVIVKTPEEDRILSNGARLIRLKYRNILGDSISGKVRAVKGLYDILDKEKPDVIVHHGLQSYELLTIVRYKKNYPRVKLYLDSHADFNNSATNFLSKYVLHKMYYNFIINKALPYVHKVLCVGYESFAFLRQLYGVPDDIMEFYPLGGIIFEESVRQEKRDRIRKELMLKEDDVLLVHSGKMDKLKRTEDLLKAFIQVPDDRLKLILIGSMEEDVKKNTDKLIVSDKRIKFLGWKNGDELLEYLCACDLYAQPGSQSATLQNALCCGSAAMLYTHESYKYLLKNSVFYIKTIEDIKSVLEEISKNRESLENKRAQTNKIAREILDYKKLAARVYR
jgi:glycosyltransferase involved in cell wall biosynthesis